jgi:hypothetical protein
VGLLRGREADEVSDALVTLQRELKGVHALALGVLAGHRAAAVVVQSRHALAPGLRLVIEEELRSQRDAHVIIIR